MPISKTTLVLVLFLAVTVSGCLSIEEIHYRYDVKKDLSTQVRIDARGIHSDESSEANQKAEMRELFDDFDDDGSLDDVAGIAGITGAATVTFQNKTETRADAVLTGEAHHFLQALVVILDGSDFTISRKGSALSVEVATEEPPEEKGTLTISYAGDIISSNAHSSDQHLLVWNNEELAESGIQFVLETR